jgi:DNA-3-methyladenine glycosylase
MAGVVEEKPLGLAFYARPSLEVAPDLIGKVLVRRVGGETRRVRVVETEAYAGPADLASHASKGLTKRTASLFGPAGRAYVYFVYGMHDMFNVVTGGGEAVLIRAGEPLDGWQVDLSGPAKLARALQITRADDAADLTAGDALFVAEPPPGGRVPTIARTRRVGIDYAKEWRDALYRFIDADSRAVSKVRWKAP